jgi:hypothetical protein
MKKFGSPLGVLAALILAALTCIAQQSQPASTRLSLPAKDWGVALNLPGFSVKNTETKPDGRRYMIAENDATHLVVSLFLERVQSATSENSCRDSLEKKDKIVADES